MELKPGYKRLEVGVIPEDWDTDTLLTISCHIMDFRGRTPRKLGMEWGGGDIPALSAGNVRMGFVDFKEACNFGSQQLYRRWMTKGDLAIDDIIFTTEAPLGNVALVPDNRRYILSQRTVLLRVDPDRVLSRFIFQVMLSGGFQRMLADYASGSTARGIQRKKLEQLCVPIPPLHEQGAIAAALDDVDALLGALDRLIAKKRDVKQAAMQQLLTGQTRLHGFDGEWETVRVAEIGATYGGLTGKKNADFGVGHARYVTFLNVLENVIIDPRQCEPVCVAPGERQNPVHRGDILFNGTSETPDDLAMAAVTRIDEENLFLNSFCFGFRVHDPSEQLPLFFAYYFRGSPGRHIMRALAQGATRYNMSKSQFRGLALSLPPFDEQTAIATVLSDMDAEIAALDARRDKTRNLKQGMMQELLTGRTRLI